MRIITNYKAFVQKYISKFKFFSFCWVQILNSSLFKKNVIDLYSTIFKHFVISLKIVSFIRVHTLFIRNYESRQFFLKTRRYSFCVPIQQFYSFSASHAALNLDKFPMTKWSQNSSEE